MAPFRLVTRKLRARRRALVRGAAARAPAAVQPSPAQPAHAQPAAVRPAHAQPAPVQPSQAQPAPVQPVPVPWRVVRRSLGAIDLEWLGVEAARHVRFALSGAGMLGLSLPRLVQPGERIRVAVRGFDARGAAGARDAMLVLRWFQPDGTELLWPIPVE